MLCGAPFPIASSLQNNVLSGPIPDSFCDVFTSLKTCGLSGPQMSFDVPLPSACAGNLTTLCHVGAGAAGGSGPLFDALVGGLTSLVVVGIVVAVVVVRKRHGKPRRSTKAVSAERERGFSLPALQLFAETLTAGLLGNSHGQDNEGAFSRVAALVGEEGVDWKLWAPVERLIEALQGHDLSGHGGGGATCEQPCPWCEAAGIVAAAHADTKMLLESCLQNRDYSGTEIYLARLQLLEVASGRSHDTDNHASGSAQSTLEFVVPGLLLHKDRFNPNCDAFLGRGASAIVSRGFHVETLGGQEVRTVVAVKEVAKTGEHSQQDIVKEYLLLSKKLQPQHPNVIRLHALKTTSTTFCVVMECCHFSVEHVPPDFAEFLRDEHASGAVVLNALVQDMLRGLQFLHSRQVAHCDVKPANMLVQFDRSGKPRSLKRSHWKEAQLKLSDFGVSRLLDGSKTQGMVTATMTMTAHSWLSASEQGEHIAGTAAFMSAELLRKFHPSAVASRTETNENLESLLDNDTLKFNDAFGCGCSIAVLCGVGEHRHPFFHAGSTSSVPENILAGFRVQLDTLGIQNSLHVELVDRLASGDAQHRWSVKDAITQSAVFAAEQRMHKSEDWSILLDHLSFREKPEGSCWQQLLDLPSGITESEHFPHMKTAIHDKTQSLRASDIPLPEKLDEDSLVALVAYTLDNRGTRESNIYFACNLALRERDTNPTAFNSWKGYLFYLMRALDILPPQTLTVYRGIATPQGLDAMEQNYQPGRPVQWRSFTSTSSDVKSCKLFVKDKDHGVIFKIDVVSGRDIQEYSRFSGEREILLTPNTRFVVTRALYRDEEGYACIDLVESAGSELAY